MFSSVFLFIMLLAFKHTHLISDFDVFPCIPLRHYSSPRVTELNTVTVM